MNANTTNKALIRWIPLLLILIGTAVLASVCAQWALCAMSVVATFWLVIVLWRTQASEHQRRSLEQAQAGQARQQGLARQSEVQLVADKLSEQFKAIHQDLNLVVDIIRSATNALSGSFTGLETESSGQQRVLKDMIDELVQVATSDEHVEQTRGLHRFAGQTQSIVHGLRSNSMLRFATN